MLPAAEDALRKGVRALCVISAGFAEIGAEGVERQERLLALVRSHGARLDRPELPRHRRRRAAAQRDLRAEALPPGSIGFSSQSGALGLALIEAAEQRGLGLSAFVSIGNKADVSSNDLLEWWEDDDATDLVAALPRVVRQPAQVRAHRAACRALEADPRAEGGHDARRRARGGSHTAALAGSDAAVDALFRQAGVHPRRTLEELVDVAALLSRSRCRAAAGSRSLTNAGGLGILCADACEAAGLELPELADETRGARCARCCPREASVANPVDLLGSATAATYEAALPLGARRSRASTR